MSISFDMGFYFSPHCTIALRLFWLYFEVHTMNNISLLRKTKNISQADLAKFLGVTQATVSKYELNQIKIPPEIIGKLCSAFNVTSDYLLGFSDTNAKSPAAQGSEAVVDFGSSSVDMDTFTRIQRANKLFLSLDDAGKAQALAYLEFLEAQQSKAPEAQD